MGENLDEPGRMAVRTPMQWSSGPNAGFSTARSSRLVSRLPDGGYGPEHVNVAAARRDPDSLLNFIRLLAQRYRESPELGWGECEVLEHEVPSVLALRHTWEQASMVALHNLSSEAATLSLTLGAPPIDNTGQEVGWHDVRLIDLLASGTYPDEGVPVSDEGTVELPLEGYGHAWLRVQRPGQRRLV